MRNQAAGCMALLNIVYGLAIVAGPFVAGYMIYEHGLRARETLTVAGLWVAVLLLFPIHIAIWRRVRGSW